MQNALGDLIKQADLMKNIDSHEVLSYLLSNPTRVANEIRASNKALAKTHAKFARNAFSASLNALNRLNKLSAPSKIALSNIARFAPASAKTRS